MLPVPGVRRMRNSGGVVTAAPTVFYKVLGAKGEAVHGGRGSWFLPVGKRPGKWMPKIDAPALCSRGYHLTTVDHLSEHLSCARLICEAEIRDDVVVGDNKVVVGQARIVKAWKWDDRMARLFAADCAERVLPSFEARYPSDDRPRRAIDAARGFANGTVTEVGPAAAAAAAAAYSADAAYSAAAAADDAAYERSWQGQRVIRYLHANRKAAS